MSPNAARELEEEICHCRRITSAALYELCALGATHLTEFIHRTSAGSGCGTCRPRIQSLVGSYQNRAICPLVLQVLDKGQIGCENRPIPSTRDERKSS